MDLSLVMEYKKIWILGSVASGKTTLATKLSKLMNCYQYELDNLVWIRRNTGDVRRTKTQINRVLDRIYKTQSWIVEGVYREDYSVLLEKVDIILLLNTPAHVREDRILKRWVKQRYGFECCNYMPTVKMLQSMYAWSRGYEDNYSALQEILEPYKTKIQIVNLDGLKELLELSY